MSTVPYSYTAPEYHALLREPPEGFFSRATLDASSDAFRACANRLSSQGIDLAGYTVTETVDDLEAARQAWGDASVHTLSQSYGTRLALVWAWRYPESLHRSALISVNPPGHFIWYPEIIQQQLEYYSELCARDAGCAARTEDLAAAMGRVSRSMPDRWLLFPIQRDNVLMSSFMLLYHTTTAPQVFDAWLDADEGDPSGLAVLSIMADLLFPSAPIAWGESVAKVTSTDYIHVPGRDYLREMVPHNTILGAPMSLAGFAGARGWPGNLIDESLRQVQASSVEMLLISGSIDFSTPAQPATEKLLPALENGHQVVLREFGHTDDIWQLQPEATRQLLTTWFATGAVDDSGFVEQPVEFDPGIGIGTLAKLALAGTFATVALLVAATCWLIRRARRGRRQTALASVSTGQP